MKHLMPELPYGKEAFAPVLSEESFNYHYGKHLQTYIDTLNKLIEGTGYENMSMEEIIMKADGPVYNNAAQAWNHTLFFLTLTPSKKTMPEKLSSLVRRDFGSEEQFRDQFIAKATAQFIPSACRKRNLTATATASAQCVFWKLIATAAGSAKK